MLSEAHRKPWASPILSHSPHTKKSKMSLHSILGTSPTFLCGSVRSLLPKQAKFTNEPHFYVA